MTNEELVELELEPTDFLETNMFRIVDIRCDQYGVGQNEDVEYGGIFTVVVPSPMSLYYQGRIKNTPEMDECFKFLTLLEDGVETSTKWFRNSDRASSEFKLE